MKREALPDLLVLGHSGFAGGIGSGQLLALRGRKLKVGNRARVEVR